jgi:hypothetical protein
MATSPLYVYGPEKTLHIDFVGMWTLIFVVETKNRVGPHPACVPEPPHPTNDFYKEFRVLLFMTYGI